MRFVAIDRLFSSGMSFRRIERIGVAFFSIPAADCIRKLKMGRASGYSAAFDGSLSLRIPSEEESGSRPTHPVHVSMR